MVPRPCCWPWLMTLFPLASKGMCPKGFGGGGFFPPEWQIPQWPADLPLEQTSALRTVTLGGFEMKALNEEYLEGPTEEFKIQGRESYWQSSGDYFMYWCRRFSKWRIAAISAFGQNMEGNCFAFVSDGSQGRDILNASLIKGWIEVEKGQWVFREHAGVVEVGKLGDQLALEDETDELEEDENASACDADEDKSNCPVMPHVRKLKKKTMQAARAAGNWVRRLFPKYLGAPDEEDAIPEEDGKENPLFKNRAPQTSDFDDPDDKCNPDTLDACSYKQKFYIDKQGKLSREKRESELTRLQGMLSVAMKPEQLEWLKVRIRILQKMVSKDSKNEL